MAGLVDRVSGARLDPAAEAEIRYLEAMIARLRAGEEDPEDFRVFRLKNGIYGIRGRPEHHMIRIKLPVGRITPEGLRVLADVAERYAENRLAHVTTRQAVQLHHVHRRDVPKVLRAVNAVGLTTREACGHSIRAITCCPYAGVSPEEPFDVTPYAEAAYRYFLRHPVGQNLPRKFKIAFEGCAADHARTPIHDIGVVAALEGGKRGFRVYVGGGLGAAPMSAELLEAFTPEEDLLPTMLAIVRLFDRYGNRKVLTQARLKFLVKKWGIAAFREAVREERRLVKLTASGEDPEAWAPPQSPSPQGFPARPKSPSPLPQALTPGGAPTSSSKSRRASIPSPSASPWGTSPRKASGPWRPSPRPTPPRSGAPSARTSSSASSPRRPWVGFTRPSWRRGSLSLRPTPSWTSPAAPGPTPATWPSPAPGARPGPRGPPRHAPPGPGPGGQGHRRQDLRLPQLLRPAPHRRHRLLRFKPQGGRKGGAPLRPPPGRAHPGGEARFGQVVGRLPARRVPEAVERILKRYLEERQNGESFQAYLDRVGAASFKPLLQELQEVPPYEEAPEFYQDLGAEGEAFSVQLGRGECAV